MAHTLKNKIRLTYEDYLLFPPDRNRHELIDGDHHMTPSPIFKHQRVSMRLAAILEGFVHSEKMGIILAAPMDVVLSDIDVVQPDIIFISSKNSRIITKKCIKGAPDLVVEILSDASRKIDRILKKDLYARYGVGEYWIIDPEIETLEAYKPQQGGYKKTAEYERKDSFAPALFKPLDIALEKVFE
ncbi:MAG: Uma2 family endonuclease [Candidatus Omnitrophica bacterium]|nr:Uma2 family endonuclease [Candidatus Omnitrophota bacterium]